MTSFLDELCEINVKVLRTSARAVLVQPVHSGREPAWVPLSLVELSANEDGSSHQLVIPEWLANTKGLL